MLSGEPVAQASMCAADITMQSSCCCLLRWLRPFYSSLSSSCVQHQSNQPTPSPLSPGHLAGLALSPTQLQMASSPPLWCSPAVATRPRSLSQRQRLWT